MKVRHARTCPFNLLYLYSLQALKYNTITFKENDIYHFYFESERLWQRGMFSNWLCGSFDAISVFLLLFSSWLLVWRIILFESENQSRIMYHNVLNWHQSLFLLICSFLYYQFWINRNSSCYVLGFLLSFSNSFFFLFEA